MVYFERITYGTAVKKLGSLMDIAPMLRKMQEQFPRRVVLLPQTKEAERLWRYWLRYMVEKEGAVDFRNRRQYMEIEAFMRSTRMGAAHIADCFDVVEEGYYYLQHLGDDSRVVGQQSSNGYLNNPDPEGPDILVDRNPYFNHVINLIKMPRPAFMYAAVDMVKWLVQVDRENPLFSFGGFQPVPVLWTTKQEVDAAADFFEAKGLAPEKTVGLHLTASTFRSFDRMMSRSEFMNLSRYLIKHGLTVLLITGTMGELQAPEERGESWQIHKQFYEELNAEAPGQVELYHGDVLEQAEVMRRCKFFVSPETGPAHLASAVGVPKITIAVEGFQVDNFLLTGPQDYGFLVPGHRLDSPLKLLDMVEALEEMIHRPYAPHPLFAQSLNDRNLIVSAGRETEILGF